MLLFLVVYDELPASIIHVCALYLDCINHLLERKAAGEANSFAADRACIAKLSTAYITYSMSNLALKIKKVSMLSDSTHQVNDNDRI